MAETMSQRPPSFHTQLLDRYECASSTLHFLVLGSVNALSTLVHSKYLALSTDAHDLRRADYFSALDSMLEF